MPRSGWIVALLALLVAAFVAPARAQSQDVTEKLSNDEMEKVVRGMGFDLEKIDEKTFKFELEGYKVVLFNYESNCQLYAGFTTNCSIKKVNEWNQKKRFSRAYIDDEGDPCIEADLDFEGGVSRDAIKEFVRTFRLSVRQFAKFVEEP